MRIASRLPKYYNLDVIIFKYLLKTSGRYLVHESWNISMLRWAIERMEKTERGTRWTEIRLLS